MSGSIQSSSKSTSVWTCPRASVKRLSLITWRKSLKKMSEIRLRREKEEAERKLNLFIKHTNVKSWPYVGQQKGSREHAILASSAKLAYLKQEIKKRETV